MGCKPSREDTSVPRSLLELVESEWSRRRSRRWECMERLWGLRAWRYSASFKRLFEHYALKARIILGLLGASSSDVVVDVGAGPGTYTIPFALYCRRVVAIEPCREMVEELLENARRLGLDNIEVVKARWEDVDVNKLGDVDYIVAVHSLPCMSRLSDNISKMVKAARRGICIVMFAGEPPWRRLYHEAARILGVGGRFKYLDYIYPYIVLHEIGVYASIRILEWVYTEEYDDEYSAAMRWLSPVAAEHGVRVTEDHVRRMERIVVNLARRINGRLVLSSRVREAIIYATWTRSS